MHDVVGLGDPVLDIVARVDHELLQKVGAEPGGCLPVSAEEMARLLAMPELRSNMMRIPGGSAANVLKGLASLASSSSSSSSISTSASSSIRSLSVAFVGMVGADEVGREYRRSIAAHGVDPLLLESSSGAATATCLCLVTPDGQRTMRTALCAALELNTPQQLPPELTPPSASGAGNDGDGGGGGGGGGLALLHAEGYCLYRVHVAAAAMRAARARGAKLSLDLASFEVVANCWAALCSLLQERLVDIVFCNEQEAAALCQAASVQLPPGASGQQVVAAAQDYLLRQGVGTVIISRGGKGCSAKSGTPVTLPVLLVTHSGCFALLRSVGPGLPSTCRYASTSGSRIASCCAAADGVTAVCAASSVAVVDTVGAGDYFTSGCLLGLLSGASLAACTACGCAAGTAAVQTAGAELEAQALRQLRVRIAGILAADGAAGGKAHGPAAGDAAVGDCTSSLQRLREQEALAA
ncbi:putative sugar kinase [Chlorella vulgaris]